jgi:hypothetical protein
MPVQIQIQRLGRRIGGIDLGRDGAGGLGLTAAYELKEPGKGEKSLFHGAT